MSMKIVKKDLRRKIKDYIYDFLFYVSIQGYGYAYYSREERENISKYLDSLDPDTVEPEEILITESQIFPNHIKKEKCDVCGNHTYELFEITIPLKEKLSICDCCIDKIYNIKEGLKQR